MIRGAPYGQSQPRAAFSVAIYTSAFWDSDCCGAPFWRVMFGDGSPDRYLCRGCGVECDPVRSKGEADASA